MYTPNYNKTLLLALPYAGANSYCYNFLTPLLPPEIELVTLEYPGRGNKSDIPLISDMKLLVANLITQYRLLLHKLKPGKVVLYGHSLGTVIGLAMLHELNRQKDLLYPAMAIFSGQGSPVTTPKKQLLHLNDDELIDYFKEIGSLREEIAAEKDLMNYLLPILRNDLACYDSTNNAYSGKLQLPFTIINGNNDDILPEHINDWGKETEGETKFYQLDGHHFFISQYPVPFSRIIINAINSR
ncbi:thioesterase II family protein [Mucilaginibacter calamicampi]|uniref:Thioesterase II family protein n=1 Tax=Mucilaginibacter calamicampi TaxID=1302352 RepID=A0ABW2YSB3_9SPHI